jgi:CheY-like chemotaxis protein
MDPQTILVVDDEPSIRTLVSKFLTRKGMRVIAASHGGEAIERLAATDALDAAVIDLKMPVMGGAELCERLRAKPRFATLPILLISGADTVFGEAERLGADAMSKPLHLADLFERLTRLVGVERRGPQ